MTNNYCVILAGGIGSRFWPFSRETYPKQFLDFFGTGRSLLQITYDRFTQIIPKENIYIATNESYSDLVRQQLPQLKDGQILLEPTRRNTAPSVAYAAYHIRAINPDANIVVAPSDHLILKEDVFLEEVRKGLDFVRDNDALLTMGIRPSRPETGYGYIQSCDLTTDGITQVKTFTEKPNLELAKIFYESGEFFWNSGIFMWNVNAIIDAFHKYLPEIAVRFDLGAPIFNTPEEHAFIHQNFPYCLNISIDYGIMEKAENVYMLCIDMGWADLGLLYESSGNVIALNDPNRLAVIQGLQDYIVAESGNVLLICKREDEQRIKEFMADAQMKFGKEYN